MPTVPWHAPETKVADAKTTSRLAVGFVLADHFTLSALSLFVDVLRLAADEGDRSRPIRCRWSIMGSTGETVLSSCGMRVEPTGRFVDPASFDYIVVVGGLLHRGRQVDDATAAYLKRAAAAGVPLIGVCTGTFVLCGAGLMDGRRCCVSWYHRQDFLEAFPDVEPIADRLFVVDRDRITCSGGGGVADLAAWLVERHLGRAVAQKALHVLQFGHARQGTEAQPHPPLEAAVADERVRRALLAMEQNIADPLPIGAIAEPLGLSVRQLERLFRTVVGLSPAAVYRSLRLRWARWAIEHTDRSVTDVAMEAGFADCAHFSRQYREVFGTTPTAARASVPRPMPEPSPLGRAGLRTGSREPISDRRIFE